MGFVANFIHFSAVQKLQKSVKIWQSYREFKRWELFSEIQCRYSCVSLLCFCDLDLNPMTLIYKLDLHILKMYLPTKNEVYSLSFLRGKLLNNPSILTTYIFRRHCPDFALTFRHSPICNLL